MSDDNLPTALDDGLTIQQRAFVRFFAECGNAVQAAKRAGYSDPQRAAWRIFRMPEIVAATMREQKLRLCSEIVPVAVEAHLKMLRDPRVPHTARVSAIKLAYEYGLAQQNSTNEKDPSTMSPEEISALIKQLQAQQSNLKTVTIEDGVTEIDVSLTPPESPEPEQDFFS